MTTLEALSLAIARDQGTHEHTQRVRTSAVSLARAVGVTDEAMIEAIDKAALLHDVGKLAVPERICNKPGRLTESEFEVMKQHVDIGVAMLSRVRLPGQVVPIVHSHHENWNGTGYPQGLQGCQIPLGARILSVVDCFDALTSDRPYRARLAPAEAMNIVVERRGTMYDPAIVDTFVHMSGHPRIH
jgi:putative nucleotidyltransferase with HDIG domain